MLIAMHKPAWVPHDKMFMPLFVGAEGKKSWESDKFVVRDDYGDNISNKNPYYCELTGLYWAWKNLNCDYIGLSHYRCYFAKDVFLKTVEYRKKTILSQKDIDKLLDEGDILLPEKSVLDNDTVRSYYELAHVAKDLATVENIIATKYPKYVDSFNKVMNEHSISYYNMFVMKKELFDEYCTWLFGILFESENQIDISNYDDYQKRVYGFLAERLFSVWIDFKKLRPVYCKVVKLAEGDRSFFKICWYKLQDFVCYCFGIQS